MEDVNEDRRLNISQPGAKPIPTKHRLSFKTSTVSNVKPAHFC